MRKIIKARIEQPDLSRGLIAAALSENGGQAVVHAEYDDGTSGVALRYYPDELSFQAGEFVGLTDAEVGSLFHRRDVAYLRS